MPVDFQFDRLRIERFRGISDFALPFSRGVPTYLIGGNNTGKSTLLDAFALALRAGGFHAYDVEDFDFHRNRSDGQVANEFVITVHFKATRPEDLPAVQGVGDPVPVHGVRAVGKRNGSDFELRTQLLDHEGERILLSPRTPLKAEAKKKYKGRGLGWGSFDLAKLLELLRELEACHRQASYFAIAALIRTILDHVPPIFGFRTFAEVAANYGGGRSFKDSMIRLQESARTIADQHLHAPIRAREVIPAFPQVDFRPELDLVLAEIVRKLKP